MHSASYLGPSLLFEAPLVLFLLSPYDGSGARFRPVRM